MHFRESVRSDEVVSIRIEEGKLRFREHSKDLDVSNLTNLRSLDSLSLSGQTYSEEISRRDRVSFAVLDINPSGCYALGVLGCSVPNEKSGGTLFTRSLWS